MKRLTAKYLLFIVISVILLAGYQGFTQIAEGVAPDRELPKGPDGRSGGGSPPSGSTCSDGVNQCFGAIGINCIGVMPNQFPLPQAEAGFHAGCLDGWCWVNAGSWAHDECCVTTPTGRWCGGPPSAGNAGCVASWERAKHRVLHGLNWKRRIDMCRVDADGIVNFAEYCAHSGAIVAAADANRCCSRATRPYSAATDAAQSRAQGVSFDGSFTPVVCTAPPLSPPLPPTVPQPVKTCFTSAGCAADEICLDPSWVSGTQKYCLKK